jgi:hypothetical protein
MTVPTATPTAAMTNAAGSTHPGRRGPSDCVMRLLTHVIFGPSQTTRAG